MNVMILITGLGAMFATGGVVKAAAGVAEVCPLIVDTPAAAIRGWVDCLDDAGGSARGFSPDAGAARRAAGESFCNALSCAVETWADAEAVDLRGDFAAGKFGGVSDAPLEFRGDLAAGDFGEVPEESADCPVELADPLSGVSAKQIAGAAAIAADTPRMTAKPLSRPRCLT